MIYKSTKTYGHDVGLSCCFRQWRAESHCSKIHGYALAVTLEFSTDKLDHRNWVVDFGGLKEIKEWLKTNFDHTLLLAQDDPLRDEIFSLHEDFGAAHVVLVENTGCEAFAKTIGDHVGKWVLDTTEHAWLSRVEVREHGANSASIEYSVEDWDIL